jgi:hypothetical protein
MFKYVVRFILRSRLAILIGIGLITIFMGYHAVNLKMSYELAQMLPKSDSTSIAYEEFKEIFGNDGNVIFLGIESERLFDLDFFNEWYDLTYEVREVEGVTEVLSTARMYRMVKNDSLKKFDFSPIFKEKPQTQAALDSLKAIIYSQPLFEDMLYNRKNHSTIMMITLNKKLLNSKERVNLISRIESVCQPFADKNNVILHFSGLPYIRTVTSQTIQKELLLFMLLAVLITSFALFLFFRSLKAVIFPMIVVIISVIWLMGIMVLMGYQITILTGILPPLLIVIGVENNIFILNKYHHEFRSHGNKVKALSRVVQKVGNATFLTNLTTAIGFAAFIITGNKILVEFGIAAAISIMSVFLLSIMLIPIFFSYFQPPEQKHIKHLDNYLTNKIIRHILFVVSKKRQRIYIITIITLALGIAGVTQLRTTGRLVDDISEDDKLYQDLMFLQKQVNGILPFEIAIDTKKPKGVLSLSTLRRIDRLQDTLATYPEFSKPLSIVEVAKASKQAFYNGKRKYYTLPNFQEKNFIMSYIPGLTNKSNERTILNSFVDSSLQVTRVSVQMANIGTSRIQEIKETLQPQLDEIFPPDRYDVIMTGTTIVYLKGTDYMIRNLLQSLLLALAAITVLMALLFTSGKMVGISLFTNLIPQLLTAALMGFLAISVKTSTLLIFSIALGISVDNAIHFLSRYRMELKQHNWKIKISVIRALRETSYSMVYSFIVLFFGFAIFILSTFDGTRSLGFLVPFTLLIAVLANLFLLPALILSLDKWVTTRAFREPPMIDLLDEDDNEDSGKKEAEEVIPKHQS